MPLELLTESFSVDLSKINLNEAITEALKSTDKGLYLTLPVCRLNKPTLNDRTYTAEGMTKSIQEATEAMKSRRLTCSADDHPPTVNVAPIKASHLVIDAWVEGNTLWNKWQVLETDNGRNLKALIEGRVSIGTSIRGLGRVDENKVIQDYKFLGCDCVGTPAAGTYALAGSDGVKVELVGESYKSPGQMSDDELMDRYNELTKNNRNPDNRDADASELKKIKDELKSRGFDRTGESVKTEAMNGNANWKDDVGEGHQEILKKYGFKFSHTFKNDNDYIHVFDNPKGHQVLFGDEIEHISPSGHTSVVKGGLETHLHFAHDKAHESVTESQKVNVKGAGLVGNNSIIEFRGIKWRVANIAGDSDQWCMSLMNDSGGPPAYIYSFDVQPNESIKIIKESSKENSMSPKVKFWLGQVTEAVATLESLRKGSSDREANRHIARFDSKLVDSDLDSEELKKVNEAWDLGKSAHPAIDRKEEPQGLVAQVESLQTMVKTLIEKVDPKPVVVPKVEKVLSEDELSAVIRAKYKLDESQIKSLMASFKHTKGNAIKFSESCDLITKGRVSSIDVYTDLLTGTGDLKATIESFVNINTLYTALEKVANDLFENISDGKLIKAEVVRAGFTESLNQVRQALQVVSVRESVARELAVESQFQLVQLAERVQNIVKDLKNLTQAQSRVIEAVRRELRQGGAGRVQVESQTTDINTNPLVEQVQGHRDWI